MGQANSVSASYHLQLHPLRKKLKNYRKRLKTFKQQLIFTASKLKAVPESSADYTVFTQFKQFEDIFPEDHIKSLLNFAESLSYRLRLCDRVYIEYMLTQTLSSGLMSISRDQDDKIDKIYKDIGNPKCYANQSDVDILTRKAQKSLQSHEVHTKEILKDMLSKYIQMSRLRADIQLMVFKGLQTSLNCDTSISEEFQVNVKRDVDMAIKQLLDHFMYTANGQRTEVPLIIQSADNPPDDMKPPPYQSLFNVPDWSFPN